MFTLYSIVGENFPSCSAINGLAFSDSGVIESFSDFGDFFGVLFSELLIVAGRKMIL